MAKINTVDQYINAHTAWTAQLKVLRKLRVYSEYIIEGRRDETKQKRIEEIIPMIKVGINCRKVNIQNSCDLTFTAACF